jgi:predicted SPOUT superfamily RNA methylase MTH1
LRKHVFGEHPNLRGTGKMPPLDMPHHLKRDEWCQYREGISLPAAASKASKKKESPSTLVDCGFEHPVRVSVFIPPNQRMTLKFADEDPPPNWPHLTKAEIENLDVEPTDPNAPREEGGYYWGYGTRRANSLSAIYTECPYEVNGEIGYDCSIGTSERGVSLSDIIPLSHKLSSSSSVKAPAQLPSRYRHLLVIFGGVAGLEPAVVNDPELGAKGFTKEKAHEAFDYWVNLVPGQGSRTIRLEEAVLLGLMGLKPYTDARAEMKDIPSQSAGLVNVLGKPDGKPDGTYEEDEEENEVDESAEDQDGEEDEGNDTDSS